MASAERAFIDGKEGGGGALPGQVIAPATGLPCAEVIPAEPADVEAAVAGAHRAWRGGWRDLAPGKRADLLRAVARQLAQHADALARIESLNAGKPIADARDEVGAAVRTFEHYAGAVTRLTGQTIPVARGGFDFTLRQPLGVVAAIVPWNFPLLIACWKVAPALAAGNTVVLKPASLTPLTALRLGAIAREAGLPPCVLQVLPGPGSAIGDALVTHPLVRKIAFTGSTAVGSRLMALAAQDLKRVSLELGGKSPNIVFADADVDKAAASSPLSVFANAGQDCCARSRIFVERKVFDRFMDGFVRATRALAVGDPSLESTQVGPLVSPGQREISERFLAEAKAAGRTVACGGERLFTNGFYLSPAVLLGVEPGDRVWREEVFGPVACVRPFDDEAAMLEEVNASPYGLSASLWTNDLSRALRVAARVESGVISINCHNSVHLEAPFGGFKRSGIGRDLGDAALESYTEVKNVYVAP